MKTINRPVSQTRFSSNPRQSSQQLSLATLRAGNFLCVISLFFGVAAAFVSGSLEQRIGSLLFFGLLPAAGFHAGGIILGRLLALSSEVCERIAALCFRWLAHVVKKDLTLASGFVSRVSVRYLTVPARIVVWKVSRPSGMACRSIDLGCRHADRAIFEFSCLLIRSGARFILRMQGSSKMSRR